MSQGEGRVKEVFVMRCLACLGIVLYNTLNTTIAHFRLEESAGQALLLRLLDMIQMLVMFSTPMFVFISEFLLARAYGERVPPDFFRKRAKFILAPYVTIAVFYSWIEALYDMPSPTWADYAYEFAKNVLLADFYGYFLLVIFQFYVLHVLFAKYVYRKVPMRLAIGAAVAVNALYLAPFNLLDLTSALNVNYYAVSFMNKVPFPAWIAYFTIAFYCGKHYDKLAERLRRHRVRMYVLTAAAAGLVLLMQQTGVIAHVYSKRFDVLIYTIGVIFCLLDASGRLREVPRLAMRVSQYSFSIFLLSRYAIAALDFALPVSDSGWYILLYIAITFVLSIAASVAASRLLNKLPYGALIAGRIGIGPQRTGPGPRPALSRRLSHVIRSSGK